MRSRRIIAIGFVLLVACGGDGSVRGSTTTSTDTAGTTTVAAVTTSAAPGSTQHPDSTAQSTTTTTVPRDTNREGASGSGTVLLDGEAHEVEVVACGWLGPGGSSEPLEAEPNSRDDFRLTVLERVEDTVFVLDLDRDGGVGVAFVNILNAVVGSNADDPRNFLWGNDRQSFDRVEVAGGAVTTVAPLTVLEEPADRFSAAHEVEVDVTCTGFGGVPDQFAELVAEAAGVELPQFGASGVVTIDDVEYQVETVSCSLAGGVEGVAESAADDLVVAVVDLGTEAAGILSDTVGIDIGDTSLVADEGVDIVIDGTVLRTAGPVQLFDLTTREPAGTATVAIDCG